MTTYYWVGGSGTLTAAGTGNLSLSSGGASGAGPLTIADDLVVDANSGTGTITIGSGASAKSIDSTNAGAIVFSVSNPLTMAGNVTWGVNVSTTSTNTITWTASGSLRSNGKGSTSGVNYTISGAGITLTVLDDLTCNVLTVTQGTLDAEANLATMTFASLSSSNSNTRAVKFAGCNVFVTGNGTVWSMATTTGLTVSALNSVIKFTYANNGAVTFSGGGKTYGTLWPSAGTGDFSISSGSVIGELKLDNPKARRILFGSGNTYTISAVTNGGAAAPMFACSTSGSTYTISTAAALRIPRVLMSGCTKAGAGSITVWRGLDGGDNTNVLFANDNNGGGLAAIEEGIAA